MMTTDATASHRPARQAPPLLGALASRQFFLVLINLAIFLALTAPPSRRVSELDESQGRSLVDVLRSPDRHRDDDRPDRSGNRPVRRLGAGPLVGDDGLADAERDARDSRLAGRTDGCAALRAGQRTARRGRRNSAVPRHAWNDVGRTRDRDRAHDRTIHFVSERRALVHAVRAIRVSDTERPSVTTACP